MFCQLVFLCAISDLYVTLIIWTLECCVVYSFSSVTCLLSNMSPKTCSSKHKYDKNILINTQNQSLSETLATLIKLPTVFSKWYCVGVEMCPLIMKHYISVNLFVKMHFIGNWNKWNLFCSSIFIRSYRSPTCSEVTYLTWQYIYTVHNVILLLISL